MDTVISLLVLSALPQLVVPQAPSVTSFRAVVQIVSGDSRIFSGESVRLKCSIPDVHRSTWSYLWFSGSEQLPQFGEHLTLWKARVKESGKYYCQGVRDTAVGKIRTLLSLPVEVNVDGGWSILQVPPHPGLVGGTLKVTCRVRGTPQIHEVILYKDGVEVMRQRGLNPHVYLTNLTVQDQGMYSCRASWDADRRTHSVISAEASVQVLEVLSQPILEIVTSNNLIPAKKMKLICHHQYNAPAPAPPIHYYFYKNNERLGLATSQNHDVVKQTPGQYSCKVRVPELGLTRWSEPKSFGQVTGPQMMMPPILHPRDQRPLAPPISSPDRVLPPAAEPTAARPSPHQSTATSTFIQPTEGSTQSSGPLLKPSQPASTLQSTVQSPNPTATPATVNIFEEFAPSVTSFRAVVQIVSGDSRIFSGESIRLKCSIPDVHKSTWSYLWFSGSEQLPQFWEHLTLWKARVKESGKYYCLGVRDTAVGKIRTLLSLPVEVNVDGGWSILQVPPHPGLVGGTLKVTCRVRGTPQIHEVILYKDGVEVMRQRGLNPHVYLTNLTVQDQGMYSCRASWDADRRTHSVISAEASVQVLEVLSQPILEIVTSNNLIPAKKMKLICHHQYNAPAPAPPIHYYFYKNNERLGIATSQNHDVVKQTPGQYSCKVKVPELGLTRWSEPKSFGQVTGPQMMMPPISSPDHVLPPAAEPTVARPSPHQSTATSTFIKPTEGNTQSSGPLLKPSQPASTLQSTVQSPNQTATPATVNIFEEFGGSGESGDMSGESGDMPLDSLDSLL